MNLKRNETDIPVGFHKYASREPSTFLLMLYKSGQPPDGGHGNSRSRNEKQTNCWKCACRFIESSSERANGAAEHLDSDHSFRKTRLKPGID